MFDSEKARDLIRELLAKANGHETGSMAWNYETQLRKALAATSWDGADLRTLRYSAVRLGDCYFTHPDIQALVLQLKQALDSILTPGVEEGKAST